MAAQAQGMRLGDNRFEVGIVRDRARIGQARDLRESVLARENGASAGEERFEEHCDHLVARDARSGNVVGAYRILSPRDARKAGGYRAGRHFDLALLIVLRERMVEVDRPVVDPLYPFESVMTHLWSALACYLIENRFDYVFATAGVPLRDGGHVAASTAWRARASSAPRTFACFPERACPSTASRSPARRCSPRS